MLQGAAWVEKLLVSDYDTLTTLERLEALADLLHLALDLPSAHSSLDRHHEEVERQKRLIREEAKEERKNRQKEMAAKMTKDAEEAQARVDALRQKMLAGTHLRLSQLASLPFVPHFRQVPPPPLPPTARKVLHLVGTRSCSARNRQVPRKQQLACRGWRYRDGGTSRGASSSNCR